MMHIKTFKALAMYKWPRFINNIMSVMLVRNLRIEPF